jgi:peptide/nickel transport system permease protein
MLRFIFWRVIQAIVAMLAITIFVFVTVRLGGDPVQVLLPPEAPKWQYDEMRELLHLNDPWPVQYGYWLSHVVTGDLGVSTKLRKPVVELWVNVFRQLCSLPAQPSL